MMIPAVSAAADGDGHDCTLGELTRRVEIVYETGVTVPCEVHYYKESEAPGERQVLWRAQNEEGYCELRAAEFITKLGELGWICDVSASPAELPDTDEPAPPASDDTQALTPAEETESPDTETR